MNTPTHRTSMATARQLLLLALLWALSFAALSGLRERGAEERLGSDEPEWIAISILHWNQLVRGHPPGGVELKPSEPGVSPWKQGVQHTTFGYMNPCLPKLVWGGVLAAAGHTTASPYAFQTFHKGDPRLGSGPYRELHAPMPLVRRVVLLAASLCGALLFFVARAASGPGATGVTGGWRGALAGGTALAVWLASPLVHRTATVIRTDYFMLPFLLGLWWWTLARRDALAGRRGTRSALLAGLGAGLLGGLAVSSKLNGTLGLFAFAGAVMLDWAVGHGRDESAPRPSPLAPGAALAVAGATSFAVFCALNPLLWSGPLAGVEDILARWDKLMGYFQNEWAPKVGTEVAHTRGESLALFLDRTVTRDEPLAVATGLPWASLWIVLGLAALVFRAVRGGARQVSRAAARGSLCFVLFLVMGTALWLPLDWERLWLPSVPAFAVLAGALVATLTERRSQGASA